MNDEEERIKQEAEEYARAHKKEIAKEFTDPERFLPEENPITVFMAGSPGAGKTEYSRNLIAILERNKKRRVVRIDGDELRTYLPGYTGANSFLFQSAISILVDKIHDQVLDQKQTFLFDGTLSRYERAAYNITRSIHRGRPVLIFYVYQLPEIAWKFTKARELEEGRHIPKEAFIQQFIGARDTVEQIQKDFGRQVVIFLVKKNFETHEVEDIHEIEPNGLPIDHYVEKRYNQSDLEELL